MTGHSKYKVQVRLIGILIAGLSFSQAWQAAHAMFFNRVWFGLYTEWLWPFTNYDSDALNDVGHLLQFALGLFLIFRAGFVSRLATWGACPPNACQNCGYDVRGIGGGACPECGAAVPSPASGKPVH